MPDDELRNNANSDFFDDIAELGVEVVAVGAAAASLYRFTGGKNLSRFTERLGRQARAGLKAIDGIGYNNVNINTIGDIRKRFTDAVKAAEKDVPQTIRPEAGGLQWAREFHNLLFGKSNLFADRFRNEIITNGISDSMRRLSQLKDVENRDFVAKRLRQFIAAAGQNVTAANAASIFDNNGNITNVFIRKEFKKYANFAGHKYDHLFVGALQDIQRIATNYKTDPAADQRQMKALRNILIKTAKKPSKFERWLSKMTGDRALTYGEVIEKLEKKELTAEEVGIPGTKNTIDPLIILKKIQEELSSIDKQNKNKTEYAKAFENAIFDSALRTNGSDIYTFNAGHDFFRGFLHHVGNTLPGHFLKFNDFLRASDIKRFQSISRGSVQREIADWERRHLGLKSNGVNVLNDYFRIENDLYRYDEKLGEYTAVEAFKDMTVLEGRFGAAAKLRNSMTGIEGERYRAQGTLSRLLDINGNIEPTIFEKLFSPFFGSRNDNSYRNMLEELVLPGSLEERYDRANRLMKLFGHSSEALSQQELNLFDEYIKSHPEFKAAKDILSVLQQDDVAEGAIKGLRGHLWKNQNAETLFQELFDQANYYAKGGYRTDLTGSYQSGAKIVETFDDNLRKEFSKELLLQLVPEEKENRYGLSGFDYIQNVLLEELRNLPGEILTGAQEEKISRNAFIASLEYVTKYTFNKQAVNKTPGDIASNLDIFENLLRPGIKTDGEHAAYDLLRDIVETAESPFKKTSFNLENEIFADYYNESDTILMRKSTGPLDLLRGMNEAIQANSIDPFKQTLLDAGRQFLAGRDNMSQVTLATYIPYFFAHRLGQEDLASIGLGFSNLSTGSLPDLLKTIMFKRVIPVAFGATYLEWADDTYGFITGNRFSATAVNAAANVDLGIRRGLTALGLDQTINNVWDVFEPVQYWGGREGFYDYEQEKEYYRNGYEEVRKNRYWDFGTLNEFRGGAIDYYRPNLTRRLNSDYYNKSVYGSYWNKWSHSLLPTPTNPLSPINYILDPYYLEEMHSEDRPYPVTGTMFGQGTPWGAILNPTIGELIKPQKKMHEDRLDGTGTDVLAIIDNINRSIHQSALNKDNENVFILDNGKLTPALFRSFDHPTMFTDIINPGYSPVPAELGSQESFGVYRGGYPINAYIEKLDEESGNVNAYKTSDATSTSLLTTLSSGAARKRSTEKEFFSFAEHGLTRENVYRSAAVDIIAQANQRIFHADQYRKDSGVLVNDSLRFNNNSIDKLISDAETTNDLINAGAAGDIIHDAAVSFRLLSGIYGYGANRIGGFGDYKEKQIATSADIDSFSRNFWDFNIGGLGGGASEIGRRFFPEFNRSARVNPLVNTMPEWIPERYRTGDPYAAIPDGEARMPGVGYEALNPLHPDQFGNYGAFDRYKILADIAPYSAEYKIWRKIAKATVKAPELQKEMAEINKRVLEAGKQHDFYNYKFSDADVNREEAVITRVLSNGEFMIRDSNEIHKLAGVNFKETEGSRDILASIIHPGMTVQIATDSNQFNKRNLDEGSTVNTAMFINGESVSEMLLDQKVVERKQGKQNAADVYAMHGGVGRLLGSISESISHTYIPYISDKYLRIQDPLESYLSEQVYGTPYNTWSDVWGTYVLPFYQRSIADPWQVFKDTAWFAFLNHQQERVTGYWSKKALSAAAYFSNPGAFMGGTIGHILKADNGEGFKTGMKLGAAATMIGNLYTSTQSGPLDAALSWGQAGYILGDLLDESKVGVKTKELLEDFSKNIFRNQKSVKFRAAYALAGAAAGFLAGGAFGNGLFSEESGWKPERAYKRYEMEDYFDRLNYIKYMGLYNKAADLAMSEEGTNVRGLNNQVDEAAEELADLKIEIKELMLTAQSHNMSNKRENERLFELQMRYNELNQNQIVLKGGEYTRAALLYKQAAESTMYGLRDNASWMDISRALPKYERDYFLEFMKERDPAARKKILSKVSPFQRRALQQVWGMDYDRGPDNEEFFQEHYLPNPMWEGWDPNSDMNNIKAKTIKNEGLLFSDFGIYESQYREPDVINAPNIGIHGGDNYLLMQANLQATLSGFGLMGVDVRVEPRNVGPVQAAINVTRVATYNMEKLISDIF